MANNLDADFDKEVNLDEAFDQEQDLDAAFDAEAQVSDTDESRAAEAFLAGGFQDLTLGAMDELKGAVEAAGQAIGIKGLGQEFGKQETQSPLLLEEQPLEKLLEAYRGGREIERQRVRELEEEAPKAFTAGELSGMIGPAVATGGVGAIRGLVGAGGKALAKKGAKEAGEEATELLAKEFLEEAAEGEVKEQLGRLAASGATMGGLGAAGYSETEALEEPERLAKEIATGAGLGAGIGIVAPAAVKTGTKTLKKVGKGLKEGAKQVTEVLAGLKKGTVDEIIERADDIKHAIDYPEIQDIILDKTRGVLTSLGSLGKEASKLLSDKKSIPKVRIKKFIDDRINKIKLTADDPAVAHLDNIKKYIDDVDRFEGELLSLKDVHEIVQDVGKRAYRGVAQDAPGAVRKQLRETYHELSEVLKGAAPDKYTKYAEEMRKRYNALEQLEKKLGIKVDYDDIIQKSEDKLLKKLEEVGKVEASGRQRKDIEKLLNELEELQGRKLDEKSLGDLLKARRLQGELDKGATEYSYVGRTLGGTIAGSALGGAAGGPIGAAVGLAARPLTRAALRRSGPIGRAKISEKAAKAVDKAAEFGAPLGLAKGAITGAKIAVEDDRTATKLNDPAYLEKLITEFKKSQLPGAGVYADQLERYRNTENEQEKLQIQYNLSQQPAFRELLKQYDEIKDKKQE